MTILGRLTQHPTASDPDPRLLVRGLAIAALIGIVLVHLVQLPDTFRETAGLGALFTALVLLATLIAAALLHTDHPLLWHAAALTAAGAVGGYVLTRSVAVPFDTEDVGNWLEPLGLVALFIESSLLALYAYRLCALPQRYRSEVSSNGRIGVAAQPADRVPG